MNVEFGIILNTHCHFYSYWLCFHLYFASLVVISMGSTSSVVRLRICVITAGIKKYKSKEKEA